MRKKKRIVQISEIITAKWDGTGTFFNDLMNFNASSDRIEPTDLLDMGRSELVGKIAGKWGVNVDEVLLNIKMRARMKEIIAEAGRDHPELLEADKVGQANNMFWLMMNEMQDEKGRVDIKKIFTRWADWYSINNSA